MNKTALLALCGLVLLVAVYAQFPIERRINNALLPQGFVAWRWAEGLGRPRQITRLPNSSDLLVVETSPNRRITLLHDDNNDGVNDATERIILVDGNSTSLPQTNLGLNHAVVYRSGYIYASTDSTVYRWAFAVGSRSPITAAPEILITGIPAGGRHSTRTLNFDAAGRLYVQLGSQTDIDSDTRRSSIHSFNASYFDGTTPLTAPLDFNADGFLYAYGLRNHVAFRFDSLNRPLGVENGIDAISRSDLGGIITATNPGEELNLLPDPLSTDPNLNRFYGYPYCWSEFSLNITSGPQIPHQPGTQWADSNFMNDGVHTDTWCRSPQNNVAPVSVYDPHSATLDINFYNPTTRSSGSYFGATQQQYSGVAFTTQHGAHLYLRDPATGYQVVTTRYTGSTQSDFAVQEKSSFFRAQGPGLFPNNWWRPTSLVFAECPVAGTGGGDCLYITADANGTVLAIGYYPERYVSNAEIPDEDTDPNPCPTPAPCPSVSPCPSCPSASPAPGDCGCPSKGGETNVNFYFADMLRGAV